MATTPTKQQRYKTANQNRGRRHSISLSECMKKEVEGVMLFEQTPELKSYDDTHVPIVLLSPQYKCSLRAM